MISLKCLDYSLDRYLLTCSHICGDLIIELYLRQAVSVIVNVLPSGVSLSNVVVKQPVDKHLVAWRTAEILWFHVLFLEVASHVIKAPNNSSTY